MRKLVVSAALLVGIVMNAAPSSAQVACKTTVTSVGAFFMFLVTQSPGQTWTFATSALTPGGDTVIHVQNTDANGSFVAGNDDFGGTVASQVTVPAPSSTRTLIIFVRAYSTDTGGRCNVRATPSSGSALAWNNVLFSAGNGISPGTLAVNTRIQTARKPVPFGDHDTVMLAVSGTNPSHAAGYDDDDGVDFMSFLQLPEACLSCAVFVANYSPDSPAESVTLVWDQEAASNDADHDGLGPTLESLLGTSPTNADSDADGISDAFELFGKEASPSLIFPVYGADPAQKDLFVEADWLECPYAGCAGLDQNEVAGSDVAAWATAFLPVRVHVDTGVNNTDPNTWTTWNNWGGATRIQQSIFGPNPDWCEGMTPSRVGSFHHYIANGSSGQTKTCSAGDRNVRTAAHELGHQLFLGHGGRPFASNVNGKPNYLSMMNYHYEFDTTNAPAFSHGNFTAPSLNPSAMDEHLGVNTTLPRVMDTLSNPGDWSYKVDRVNGFVDWDRDGEFAPAGTLVRSAFTKGTNAWSYVYGVSAWAPPPGGNGPSLRDPAPVSQRVGGNIGDRIVIFGRDTSLFYIVVPNATLNQRCYNNLAPPGCDYDPSDCAQVGTARRPGPNANAVSTAPAAVDMGGGQLMVVVADGSQRLVAYFLTTNGATGQESWSAGTVLPGLISVTSAPSAVVSPSGAVYVFASTSGVLQQWVYANGAWSLGGQQMWSDGSGAISSTFGVGATIGYQDGDTTPHIYGAIPEGNIPARIEFARQEANGTWTRLTSSWSQVSTRGYAAARPFLVFQRTTPGGAAHVGRFYLGWNATFTDGTPANCQLAMTEGNLSTSTTSKRLVWLESAILFPGVAQSAVSAAYAPEWDTTFHFAGVFTLPGGGIGSAFSPIGDGAANVAHKDIDDYQYIQGALRASLGLEPLPLP